MTSVHTLLNRAKPTYGGKVADWLIQLEIDTIYSLIQQRIEWYSLFTQKWGNEFDNPINCQKHLDLMQGYFQELAFYIAYQDCEGVY